MSRFTGFPVDLNYSEHPALTFTPDCWCGEGDPVAIVTWFNNETHAPDWTDACARCLHTLLADVAPIARDGSITVEARPIETPNVTPARAASTSGVKAVAA